VIVFFLKLFTRSNIAHVCMASSVILLGIGLGQFHIGWGLVGLSAGVGLYGYLLGAE
jgi:hypothetical protein